MLFRCQIHRHIAQWLEYSLDKRNVSGSTPLMPKNSIFFMVVRHIWFKIEIKYIFLDFLGLDTVCGKQGFIL